MPETDSDCRHANPCAEVVGNDLGPAFIGDAPTLRTLATLHALADAWRRRSRELRPGVEGNVIDDSVAEGKADVLLACAVALDLVLDGKNA